MFYKLCNGFCYRFNNGCESLLKKDEDLTLKNFLLWKEKYPTSFDYHSLDYRKVFQCASRIIQDLHFFKVPVDSTTRLLITEHLINLSVEDDLLRQGLIKYCRRLKTDKETRCAITMDIITGPVPKR